MGRVEPELVGLSRKTLTRDTTRIALVHWLHSMVLHDESVVDVIELSREGVSSEMLYDLLFMSRAIGGFKNKFKK